MQAALFQRSNCKPVSANLRSLDYVKKAESPLFRSVSAETKHQMVNMVQRSLLDPADDVWILDQKRWVLTSPEGIGIEITAKEMAFLEALATTQSGPTKRQCLLHSIYRRDDYYASRALDSLVKRLRSKIGCSESGRSPIKTAHNIGYFFSADLRIRSSLPPGDGGMQQA